MSVDALIRPDLRGDFPGLSGGWHYLDSAATAQKPQAVIDAATRAMGADYATVHRGVYARSAEMTLAFEAARRKVAAFIGGAEDEVVFTRGATEAINLVAQTWGAANLKAGDRILLSLLEHHSNIVPWQLLAERTGVAIDVCPLTEDGRIDLDAAEAMLTPAHKLVAFAHVSNVLGSVLDAPRAVALAHGVGALILLDGCQAVPRLPVDVAALGCDFYAFSAHKLYGPTGIGALWGRRELLAAMPPWQGGGAMIDRVSFERTTYAPAPQRFEAGTPAIVEAIALGAAVDYVSAIGLDAIHAHEAALVAQLRRELAEYIAAHLTAAWVWGPNIPSALPFRYPSFMSCCWSFSTSLPRLPYFSKEAPYAFIGNNTAIITKISRHAKARCLIPSPPLPVYSVVKLFRHHST